MGEWVGVDVWIESDWEAFAVDYQVGPPCDTLFSEGAMASYRRVFTFLWQLKRVEHSLTAIWRKHCTTARLLQTLHRDPAMHTCHLLRHEMVHFVYNLQYYLMFEVVECASLELSERLSSASDLDGLLAAHGHFLSSIVQKLMLRPEDESTAHALKALFESVLKFAKAQDQLYMSLLEQKAAARQHADAAQASAKKGRWGAQGAVSDTLLGRVVVESRFREEVVTRGGLTLHPSSFTLHPSPFTLHPSPFILHPSPCILHPSPSPPPLTPHPSPQCVPAGTSYFLLPTITPLSPPMCASMRFITIALTTRH